MALLPAPLVPYLFILRKHLWLVGGTVAAVIAAGWLYARNSPEAYRSLAKIQVTARPTIKLEGLSLPAREDPTITSDMVYRIRNDPELARRVIAFLAEGPLDPALEGKATQADTARLASTLSPASLPGTIDVRPVFGTSYYEIVLEGPDRHLNLVVANAYAETLETISREENKRNYENAVGGAEKEFQTQKDAAEKRLKKVRDDLATLKSGFRRVDFTRRINLDQEEQGEAASRLKTLRQELETLDRDLETARATLEEVGLDLVPPAGPGLHRVLPASPSPGTAGDGEPLPHDPRLSPRVQALPRVAGDPQVKRIVEDMEAARKEDRRLADQDLRVTDKGRERQAKRIRELQGDLANATEAVLCGMAQEKDDKEEQAKRCQKRVDDLEQGASKAAEALAKAEVLEKEADGRLQEIAKLEGRLDEVNRLRQKALEAGSGGIASIRVFQRSTLAASPQVRPDRPRIYLFTGLTALLLAAGLAYLLEYLDDTVKTREDFDHLVRGVPFLGFVPALDVDDPKKRDLIAVHGRTGTPETEAFRAVRTAIQFCRPDGPVRHFLLTSAGPGEGKTTIAVNLAATFAQSGGRTLIVDADLRRARVHSATGVDNRVGLTNVLVGNMALADSVQPCPGVQGLDVLSSGPTPPNPAEILGGRRMKEFLEEASKTYDRIVIDSPPLAAVTDPCVVATYVDAVFLVISRGKTSARLIQRAREALASVGVRVHGAILNNADLRHTGYDAYYGGYYYGQGYSKAEAGTP